MRVPSVCDETGKCFETFKDWFKVIVIHQQVLDQDLSIKINQFPIFFYIFKHWDVKI